MYLVITFLFQCIPPIFSDTCLRMYAWTYEVTTPRRYSGMKKKKR